ncbi:MAG: DUF2963 domain-containing protein [Lachnospiraceae bacterium]|nr:DUF2963 domain-containing protein [Lachnospiraceae bacterium]
MRLKKFVVAAVCGAMLVAGSGFAGINSRAEEIDIVEEDLTKAEGRTETIQIDSGWYAINEYDSNGHLIKSTVYDESGNISYYAINEYDSNGHLTKDTQYDKSGNIKTSKIYNENGLDFKETNYSSDGHKVDESFREKDKEPIITKMYDEDDNVNRAVVSFRGDNDISKSSWITTSGIYCASTSPSITAGMVYEKEFSHDSIKDMEFRWLVCEESEGVWKEASPWTLNNEWIKYTPSKSGNYIFICQARIVGHEKCEISASFGTPYVKTGSGIKQICQMPYEGGGYLIGFESYDNPNQEYQYEMFVMDLSLLAAGSPTPWVHATGKITLAAGPTPEDGKTMWTVWQPQYGYYLTLFRLYDKDGNMLDEVPYGFANAY